MGLENLEIRQLVDNKKLTYREIAKQIGICPEHLSRCMRYPLKPEMKSRIISAINGQKDNCEKHQENIKISNHQPSKRRNPRMIDFIQCFRNVNQLEPVLVNPDYIVYIEIVDDEQSNIHMANGEVITVYGLETEEI